MPIERFIQRFRRGGRIPINSTVVKGYEKVFNIPNMTKYKKKCTTV